MEHSQQLEFMDSVLMHIEKPETPDGVTYEIDAKRYTSKEQLELERKKIFQDFPIVVGAVGKLENDGDYFLHDWTGVPIVVIKGKDGVIRAFVNMCRHRGVRLLEEEQGHIKRNIICPYHAWSYDTAGCLKGVFHPKGFEGVNAETHSMIPLDCHTRFGLIFVVPNPELKDKFSWDNYLQEIESVYKTFGLDSHVPYREETRSADANWKLLIDGGLEGYHFKIAHTKTIGPHFLDNASVNHANKFHSSIIFPKKSISRTTDKPREEWSIREHANIMINIFPNTIILVQPDHAMVVLNFPIDEKSTMVQSFMLIPEKADTEKKVEYWELNGNIFWEAIEEDNELAILQQKTFNNYDNMPMTIGSYEKLLVQFEGVVDDVLADKIKLTDF